MLRYLLQSRITRHVDSAASLPRGAESGARSVANQLLTGTLLIAH
jgi:hypothetical protein